MLKVEHVSKRYERKLAVDDLSFEIPAGHICGFIGPNGAGKSTTMNMITGYLPATSGTITIDGLDVRSDLTAYRRSFGYLPEIPPLYMDMLVRDYLHFVHEAKGLPKALRAEQVRRAMERTAIDGVQGRLIRNLSKGYKQRVGIAQAILGDPKLIILDEPTIGLDPTQILQIRTLLRELRGEHTVLLSSHILSEIAEVCDEVVLIHHGRIVASGSEQALIAENCPERNVLLRMARPLDEAALAALRAAPGVVGITEAADCRYEIAVRGGTEAGGKLAAALGSRASEICELALQPVTLEDVFLRLIRKNEAQDAMEESR